MSQSARYVPSPVCLEQIHRQCNCPSTGATAKNSTKAYKRNSKRSHLLPPSLRCQPKSQYYKPNRTNWKSTVKTISKIYTPCPKLFTFDLNTGESQFGFELPTRLQSILANVERLGQTYAPTRAAAAIDVWQRQIPHLSGTIHAWWQWVLQALCSQTQDGYTTLGAHNSLGSIGHLRNAMPISNWASSLWSHDRSWQAECQFQRQVLIPFLLITRQK